jgi:hypothetical protein
MTLDFNKYLDEELFRIQIRRAITRATGLNDFIDAELSKEEYQGALKPHYWYARKARENILSLNF